MTLLGKVTLVYISGTDSSVFESQVISFLKNVHQKGSFSKVVLIAGIKRKQNWDKELDKLSNYPFSVIPFTLLPNYYFFRNRQIKILKSALKKCLSDKVIIHLRGEAYSSLIKKATMNFGESNIKILTDIRGANEEEIKIYLKNIYNPIKYYIKIIQARNRLKNAVKISDHISCVSLDLKNYIIKKTNVSSNNISVNNCGADNMFNFSEDLRNEYRSKMGIEDSEILCVFVTGGNGPYQNTDLIIKTLAQKGIKTLNLSKIHVAGSINRFVPNKEMPGYLSAADIGIIWRNEDIVNKVASPVKFSEYVCCGLPIIANNGVSLIENYVRSTGFGKIIIDLDEIDLKMLFDFKILDRRVISNNGRALFSSNRIVDDYMNMYLGTVIE